jgi:predicted dehydrogenase/threonine dehydrogenase-like Zn-dependent dehydrogenase
MKQILQRLDNGQTYLLDVPVPAATGVRLVIRSRASVISAGTERMLVEFGRGSLLDKARAQPDKVRDVLAKMRTDGIMSTFEAVQGKLATPIPLGYCNAGVVVDAGPSVTRFQPGDRVVSNGAHAEFVVVSHTLAAKVPDNVSFEAAAFTPIAAIGLQGIRLAQPTLGETVVVYGLGLIGLLCVQLLRANGCAVIGIDRSASRLALAERFGARSIDGSSVDVVGQVNALTEGRGADAVLLTLASDSDEPMQDAARMSRKRGRLVLVGVTGLTLSRDEFFKKELSFQVSCSYGPGRYDPQYEERGVDYPAGYVRWTEQRNFEAVLGAMAAGQLDPTPLITHRFEFDSAPRAYELITGKESSIGVVLRYPEAKETNGNGNGAGSGRLRRIDRVERADIAERSARATTVGVIGAGNFATRMLLPILQRQRVRLRTIASGGGPSGAVAGNTFGFERVSADVDDIIGDSAIDTVFVLTRHDSHAALVIRALEAGKHVFVEKPLALSEDDIDRIEDAARNSGRLLMVGFNRRFAPLTREIMKHTTMRGGPLVVSMLVNPGAIPRNHWTQDPDTGGGRIVGEACHFIDLARVLVGHSITRLEVTAAATRGGEVVDDVASLVLSFADGSVATIAYLANGAKSFPKERIECFFDGRTLAIDNWRRLRRFNVAGPLFEFSKRPDKGHRAEIEAWLAAIRHGAPSPIPIDELLDVSRWAIRAGDAARRRSARDR